MMYRKLWQLLVAVPLLILITVAGCSSSKESGETIGLEEYPPIEILDIQEGIASYYHNKFHGRKTANGERYDKRELTAAHRTFPFGTVVRVVSEKNGESVIVRINDRGPFVRSRVIDLSREAAKHLNMIRDGIVKVRVEVLDWGKRS